MRPRVDAAPGCECVVTFQDAGFSYGASSVLEHVSLCIGAREFATIIGPNGGGKSTMLKLILGLLTPVYGRIRVFGVEPAKARTRIGYCPQYAQFDPQFPVSVMDVVLMGRVERRWGGPHSRADKEAARHAMREVALEDLANRPFEELSGGQRQRVLIARALCTEPELLLLDEPTSNVDAVTGQKLLEILSRLHERMAILLVSHDLGFVNPLVQSVICVNRTVVLHPTSEVTGAVIQEMYGGDLLMVRHDHRCGTGGHVHE